MAQLDRASALGAASHLPLRSLAKGAASPYGTNSRMEGNTPLSTRLAIVEPGRTLPAGGAFSRAAQAVTVCRGLPQQPTGSVPGTLERNTGERPPIVV